MYCHDCGEHLISFKFHESNMIFAFNPCLNVSCDRIPDTFSNDLLKV